jgi:hypothetical protein
VETLKTQYLQMKRWRRELDAKQAQAMDEQQWDFSDVKPELREEYAREFLALMAQQRELMTKQHAFGELAGVRSFDEVEALTPAEFLIRWAQARHAEYLVEGKEPWHPNETLQRRSVVGSVAVLPDTVAVVVHRAQTPGPRRAGVQYVHWIQGHSLIAVLGDNRGVWALDAAAGWLGLRDMYA